MKTNVQSGVWVGVLVMILASCTPAGGGKSSGSGDGTSGPACVVGQAVQCWCANGAVGAQTCQPDHTFGVCSCEAGAGDTVAPPQDTPGPADDPGAAIADAPALPDTGPSDTSAPKEDLVKPPPPDTGPPPPLGCSTPVFKDLASHITSLGLPATTETYLCDANGDNLLGSDDGQFNKFAQTLTTANVFLDGFFLQSVQSGEHILLLEYQSYQGGDKAGFPINILRGVEMTSQPNPDCDEGAGQSCQWKVDAQSINLANNCARQSVLPNASIQAGTLSAGPGVVQWPVVMGAGAWIELTLENARVEGTTSGQVTVQNGRLCGTFQRTPFLLAVNDLCGLDPSQDICGVKPIIPDLLNCDGETCSIVMSFEAAPVLGLSLEE